MDELVELITCKKCGQQKIPSRSTKGWCVDCEKAYNNRMSYLHRHQDNWMDVAKDSGIELWERQPNETQLEWSIWLAYRDSYPGKKPTYADVVKVVDTTVNYVKQTAGRWNFAIRMQAWIKHCDDLTLAQRRKEILGMNKEHIDMAQRLRAKLSTAIDELDPHTLKPSELGSLMKLVTDLEKKARMDTVEQEAKQADMFVDHDNPELKKSPTKQGDLSEVVQILLKAGALGDITTIGVKETKTTQVVVGDSNGNMSGIEMEE